MVYQVENQRKKAKLDKTLKGLCVTGRLKEAVGLLWRSGLQVEPETYAVLLQECKQRKEYTKGKRIHAQMVVLGFAPNEYLKVKLLIVYALSGDLQTAGIIFRSLQFRDLIPWNAMIAGTNVEGGSSYSPWCCLNLSLITLRKEMLSMVNELAEKYPGLSTLRSVDLSPASWMVIAWYPIYHIHSRKIDKDLSTCFLSYHTLSSFFQGTLVEGEDEINETMKEETLCSDDESVTKRAPLAPFGLVTYKLQGDLWGNQARIL